MFTGIVEEIGYIRKITKGVKSSRLLIQANVVIEGSKIGDSICTNGVCLTVTNIGEGIFEADIMAETLEKSNLGELKIGDKVNLERALTINSRLGGHIVSGHIDGVGKIKSLRKIDNSVEVTISAESKILKYIVLKGSIAIDGISLTVSFVDNQQFKVCIIPHTSKETILLNKEVGQTVNLECDILGKYIEKLMQFNSNKDRESKINIEFLKENGFI